MSEESKGNKSHIAKKEEEILKFWKDNHIFEKTLQKHLPKGSFFAKATKDKEFVFYEGPPTANGRPGIHHLEARSFKDLIPRYKTMQGYHVRRKGGWDTHGLPVEIQVEKELGLKSKKEIEEYGIAAFNKKCKESVWRYINEWQDFTERIGYWVDSKNAYVTYKTDYIESLWHIIKKISKDGLLYKDYKVIPWCPRCETALSSHELAQGYKDVKDLSVYAKFKVKGEENTYLLAWTTTPWTLPGNVALAVSPKITYQKVLLHKIIDKTGRTFTQSHNDNDSSVNFNYQEEIIIFAKDRLETLKKICESQGYTLKEETIENVKNKDLLGLEYEPLYPFLKDNLPQSEKSKLEKAFKVYPANFVTTEDGTGIVHTAVMYGQDDFELGTKIGLPKFHLVNENGTFKKETGFLAGKFVRDEETAVEIIKDLAHRGLLFHKEKHEHSYPHCWRCKTPLIYYARDSWFVRMSKLKDKLIAENEKINWEPSHIRDGRFGEWLKDLKDWVFSRSRFWGTPLPIWECVSCKKQEVVGSVKEISQKGKNNYFLVRHGEAESNAKNTVSALPNNPHPLTKKGEQEVRDLAKKLKSQKIDLVISSDFIRTKETANILLAELGLDTKILCFDERLREINSGDFNLKPISEYRSYFSSMLEKFTKRPPNGESLVDVKKRVGAFLAETEKTFEGKNILIVTHEYPIWMMEAAAGGWDDEKSVGVKGLHDDYVETGKHKEIQYMPLPRNEDFELDLHRPYIDSVVLRCECGSKMKRVKEVIDVWFDSGAMPFAQDHYPFENKKWVEGKGYPADYISEGIDQTRGWFYALHAVGNLMGRGLAYKNVICLGHLLDKEGKKMSKSLGNIVLPEEILNKYGADAARFWMYTVNQPGESKNFDEKTVDEVVKKVVNPLVNVLAFYTLFGGAEHRVETKAPKSSDILDEWVLTYLSKLIAEVTTHLESYKILEAARLFRDFITDLSQWYVRRSRDRFKEGSKEAVATLGFVLQELSKLLAPFMPFLAENLYQELKMKDKKESVHLEEWPLLHPNKTGLRRAGLELLEEMKKAREIVSLVLELRAKAGIKVRQPLQTLRIKNDIEQVFFKLICDEVNVKEVISDNTLSGEVTLDTAITPELKKEGELRDLLRQIQDMRKEKNLQPNQETEFIFNEKEKDVLLGFEKEIYTQTKVKLKFSKEGISLDN